MDLRSVLDQIEVLCAKVFRRGPVKLAPTSTAADVDGWDSLSHVHLLMEVEKTFAVKFSVREAMKLANVGDLAALVIAKCTQKKAA